jgi:hypothetical protein
MWLGWSKRGDGWGYLKKLLDMQENQLIRRKYVFIRKNDDEKRNSENRRGP